MSESELAENTVFTSEHGWIQIDSIQQIISGFDGPGLIYLPESTWEESLIITQHNLTILGEGENTVIKSQREQSPITIISPSVRLFNLNVRAEHDVPAISLSHGNATQGVLQNLTISSVGGSGIARNGNYAFDLTAIINCHFEDIAGNGIVAPTGTGPNNLLLGNEGKEIGGDFINWGVNESILAYNSCDDAPIQLTENAHRNLVLMDEETKISPTWPEDNFVF